LKALSINTDDGVVRISLTHYNNIKEIFFYPSGRIDIKNKDSVTIKFPKKNLEEAINIASKIINNKNLKNNVIDLRIKNHLILSDE